MSTIPLKDLEFALSEADRLGNIEDAQELADAIYSHPEFNAIQDEQKTIEQPQEQPQIEDQEEKQGFLSRVGSGLKEAFTGENRKTESTEKAQPLMDMPEIKQDIFSTFASLFAGDEELAQIMKTRFPEMKTRKDEKGNTIFISKDGIEYTNKPGASKSDIPRVIANVLSFLPAGRQPSLRGRMTGAATTQAGIESLQQQIGGEADISEVALAAAAEPVADIIAAVPGLTKKGIAKAKTLLPEKQIAEQVTEPVTKEAIELGAEEFGARSRAAATSKLTRQNEIRKLADELPIDEPTFQDAERLGITEHLQPDHLTTNQAYKSYSQAIKSLPGSKARQLEIEGLEKVTDKGQELITQFGGTEDFSTLSFDVKNQMKKTIDGLEQEANKLYSKLRDSIDPKIEVKASSILSFINKRAKDLNGFDNLTPTEKMIHRKLSPKTKTVKETIDKTITDYDQGEFVSEFGIPQPITRTVQEVQEKTVEDLPTYALLDDVRKQLTQARVKRTGAFKDADTGLIKKLESSLMEDQRSVADNLGQLELFDTARKTVAIRKSLEDDISSLFGKELDRSIVEPLTSAIKKLPKGNEDNFIEFIKRIPEDQRGEVVASGLSVAMGRQSKNGKMSFKDFGNYWDKLRENKRSYNALVSNLPKESRYLLNSYANVSKAIAETQRFIGTGRLNAIEKAMDGAAGLTTKIMRNAGIVVSSMLSPRVASMVALAKAVSPGGNKGILQLADDLISSDDFIRAVSTLPDNEEKAVKTILNSGKFKQYKKIVDKIDTELRENPEQWVRSALQATRQQREDQPNER